MKDQGSGSGSVSPGPAEGEKKAINSELWHACAGPLVSLPPVGSLVVYFPQGHSEQVAASMHKEIDSIPSYPSLPSKLICKLLSLTLHADSETDEVYAQMTLQPVNKYDRDAMLASELGLKENKQPAEFFCKTLTASDTSTHGGFSVPRRAAEKIFPPLDFTMQPPAQELIAKDLHDISWKFRHVYRGQPKRHLLTTGWSVFVSTKRLLTGDSVLFIRDEKSQLLLGTRHATRPQPALSSSVLSSDSMHIGILAAAAHAAANSSPFTIFYNPRASPSEFVVPLAKYNKALYTQVSLGMRFRMLFETEDSGVRRYMGTITGIGDLDPVRWKNSHWRNLQVGWDESTASERRTRVSIWEIEPVATPFYICPPPFFRPKLPKQPGMPDDENEVESAFKRAMPWLADDFALKDVQSALFPGLSLVQWMAMCNGSLHGNGDGRRPQARRVLLFPLPFQGHINPMLQLADVLHGRGLAVTVLHTSFNALDPALHPEFTFVSVPDGVPADVAASGNTTTIVLAMNAAMEASSSVRNVLASVLADEGQHPAACLFIDAHLLAVQKAAVGLGLPTLVLRTGSAACLGCFLAYPVLHQNGYLPPQESQLYTPVKELPPLRVRDLIYLSRSNHEMVRELLAQATETVRKSSGLVINTFDALETAELERIRGELDVAVVLAAGPLHRLSSRSTGSSLLHQDHSCIEWLDTQASGSVLYVSFGSLASMDADEFLEVAWGLANSGQPFLWVVRRDLVRGLDGSDLPDGFERAVEGRAKVIQWAPQQEVLAHHAVGGFWTHNGWNSTLESISEGVPMICRPQFADQMMNTRYVEHTWRIGFELEGVLERSKIEKAIRRLMKERDGAEMTERAKELRKQVACCLESGGSSRLAIDKLVDHIQSL